MEKQIKQNQSVQKAFKIIEIMAKETEEVSLNTISKKAGLPKSTALRLVYTLLTMGYIKQNPQTSNYQLTLKFKLLIHNMKIQDNLVGVLLPYLETISLEVKEAVCLSICEDDKLHYIETVDSQDSLLNVTQKIGKTAPLYCTAAGKIYLSQLSKEALTAYFLKTNLEPLTTYTHRKVTSIEEELETIRLNQYAIDDEECELGVRCVAVPVFDSFDNLLCTVSVSMPSIRGDNNKIQEVYHVLKEVLSEVNI